MKKFKQHVWAIYIVWCIPLVLLGFITQGISILFEYLFFAPFEVGEEYFDKSLTKIKNKFSNE